MSADERGGVTLTREQEVVADTCRVDAMLPHNASQAKAALIRLQKIALLALTPAAGAMPSEPAVIGLWRRHYGEYPGHDHRRVVVDHIDTLRSRLTAAHCAEDALKRENDAMRKRLTCGDALSDWVEIGKECFFVERAVKEELERAHCALAEASTLPADVLTMCRHRGWSLDWTHRGAYLHLEASELIEAIRGKRGDPKGEAGDVLLVLMSITEYAGIPWASVIEAARLKCNELMTKPRYAGEEHDGSALPAEPPAGDKQEQA